MEEALQILKENKNVRQEGIQAVNEFRKENLSNQAKQGEKLVAIMPGVKAAFEMMTDEIYELGTENDQLKEFIGEENMEIVNKNHKKLLQDTKNNNNIRNSYVYNRMKKKK